MIKQGKQVKGKGREETEEEEEVEEEDEEAFDNFDSSPAVPRSKRLVVDLDPVRLGRDGDRKIAFRLNSIQIDPAGAHFKAGEIGAPRLRQRRRIALILLKLLLDVVGVGAIDEVEVFHDGS